MSVPFAATQIEVAHAEHALSRQTIRGYPAHVIPHTGSAGNQSSELKLRPGLRRGYGESATNAAAIRNSAANSANAAS